MILSQLDLSLTFRINESRNIKTEAFEWYTRHLYSCSSLHVHLPTHSLHPRKKCRWRKLTIFRRTSTRLEMSYVEEKLCGLWSVWIKITMRKSDKAVKMNELNHEKKIQLLLLQSNWWSDMSFLHVFAYLFLLYNSLLSVVFTVYIILKYPATSIGMSNEDRDHVCHNREKMD